MALRLIKSNCDKNRPVVNTAAVVRAARIRIRSLCRTDVQAPGERLEIACGLIAGLREGLELDPGVGDLIAEIYELVDKESAELLETSRTMLQQAFASRDLPAFMRGLSEARAIVGMIECVKRKR